MCVFLSITGLLENSLPYRKTLLVAHRSSLLEIGKLKHYKKEILVIMIAQLHCIEISEPVNKRNTPREAMSVKLADG